jgi:hypothetical protein
VLEAARLTEGFEAALTAVGIHMTVGPDIWSQYRTYEKDELEDLQVCVFVYTASCSITFALTIEFCLQTFRSCAVTACSVSAVIVQKPASGLYPAGTALLKASPCSQHCGGAVLACFGLLNWRSTEHLMCFCSTLSAL